MAAQLDRQLDDLMGEDYLMMKVQFYLDGLTSGSGCLRVLPGSHRKGYHQSVRDFIHQCDTDNEEALTPAGIAPMDLPGAISLKTKPGDVIFFDEKLAPA